MREKSKLEIIDAQDRMYHSLFNNVVIVKSIKPLLIMIFPYFLLFFISLCHRLSKSRSVARAVTRINFSLSYS